MPAILYVSPIIPMIITTAITGPKPVCKAREIASVIIPPSP
ncbi:hypothetical protein [Sulfolobus spindle-shaped virus]|nr:hypothetical protein [Sulfolobus spindle-shaped virus]AZG03371.1 hypothetical protein [Sulfolobus spindle-shaped virus]